MMYVLATCSNVTSASRFFLSRYLIKMIGLALSRVNRVFEVKLAMLAQKLGLTWFGAQVVRSLLSLIDYR
jgi:hypothetical protein